MSGRRGGPQAVIASLLAFSLLTAGCARGGSAGSAGSAHRPGLAIASYFPPTINGRNFRAGEHVALRAQPHLGGLKPFYVRAMAGSSGTFVVRVRGYGLDRCTGFTVTATGSRGSRATVSSASSACPPVRPRMP